MYLFPDQDTHVIFISVSAYEQKTDSTNKLKTSYRHYDSAVEACTGSNGDCDAANLTPQHSLSLLPVEDQALLLGWGQVEHCSGFLSSFVLVGCLCRCFSIMKIKVIFMSPLLKS